MLTAPAASDVVLRIRGTVQGVGFRPFVHRTARRLEDIDVIVGVVGISRDITDRRRSEHVGQIMDSKIHP